MQQFVARRMVRRGAKFVEHRFSPLAQRRGLLSLARSAGRDAFQPRSAIICLVWEIARAGLSPFGQVLVQFMIVWQR